MPRLLTLAGFPKSATTLMLALLDGHRECLVFPEELKWFTKVRHLKSRADKIISILSETGAYVPSLGLINWSSGSRDYTAIRGNDYLADLVRSLLDSSGDKGLLYAIFETWARHSDQDFSSVQWLVEKTPGNELNLDLIRADFADFAMIYCLRDPRDNFYSYKVKQPGLSVEEFCKRWNRSVDAVLGSDSVMIVQYERLMADPAETMSSVSEFLNITFTESLLKPSRGGMPWSGNSMFDQNDPSRVQDFALAKRWLDMDEVDRLTIEKVCKSHMDQFGYPP